MAFSHSLIPSLLARDWWDWWDFPTRIMDQHFGMGLSDYDLCPPSLYRGYVVRPRRQANVASSGQSEVKCEKDKFQVMLNVSHFKPEEISVKTVGNHILIHGKHEEKADEHGFISREFTRKYNVPEGVEPETVSSALSADGVLTIQAPRKALEPPAANERVVPITFQSAPAVTETQPAQPAKDN